MKTIVSALLLACVPAAWAQAPAPPPAAAPPLHEYTVDFGHSIVEFSIKFAFSRVKGRFTSGKGSLLYDERRPCNSSVTMVLDSKSIDTGWPHRDEHLRTSDFFDVDTYPKIVFQSDRVRVSGDTWIAEGPLTMHGVTKRIAIPFRLTTPPVRSPESGWMVLNAAGAVRLARADFGVSGGSAYNAWFDRARQATMGDSVDVSLELEAYSADAESQRGPGVLGALERIRTEGVESQIDRLRERQRTSSAQEFARYLTGGDLVVRGLIGTGHLPDAVKLSGALVELFPTATRAAAVHALALSLSGDRRGAAREYARMRAIHRPPVVDPNEKFPQDDDTWWYLDQLARTTVEWGYAAQGLPLAQTVADLYAGTARAHTTLGLLLATTGDARSAAKAYDDALALDPHEPRALEWRRRLGRGAEPAGAGCQA